MNIGKQKDGFSGERAIILPQTVIKEMEKDPYLSILHITDIGYYPNAWNHYRERTEPINQNIFIYCIEGEGWYKKDNNEYKISNNQYFILPAGTPHAYGANDENPWTIYWIHFKGKIASTFVKLQNEPKEIKPGIHSRISDRISLFEEIFHIFEMGFSKENLLYTCSVFHHFLGSLQNIQPYRMAINNSNDDIVEAAIHYMKENIEKKLTLTDISSYTGFSSSYFSSLFCKRTGYAPLAYFNQLKIQQACVLLDFTDMKINQICYKIGIHDSFYFSRLFGKIMGMSPQKYKKMKKG